MNNPKMYYKKKKNKYLNKEWYCALKGHKHDSRGEAEYCDHLTLRVKAKDEIEKFEIQVPFVLNGVKGKKVCKHFVDFLVTYLDEKRAVEVHEYKNRKTVTPVWRLKKKLFEQEYTEIPYIVIWGK